MFWREGRRFRGGGGTHLALRARSTLWLLQAHPKKGSAILWPSVTSDDLNSQLYATHHQALPVIKGVKYAANAWIHMRSCVPSSSPHPARPS